MTYRTVHGLLWAELSESPHSRVSRPRGAKAQGLRYERIVAAALPQARHGQWFKYCDRNGLGFCQPDFLLPYNGLMLILECKLTDVPEAEGQLRQLYYPVVGHLSKLPVAGIVICKSVTANSKNIVGTLREAADLAMTGIVPTLHWLGKSRTLIDPNWRPKCSVQSSLAA